VSDGNGVEAGDAAGPEIRGDDVFAEIELRAAGTDGASSIDKQVRPWGVTSRVESPSPTSMEVTSKALGRVRGGAGMNARAREAKRMAVSPAQVRSGRRRAAHMASTSAAAASVIMASDGMGTRRSDTRRAPRPRTVPVMPSTQTWLGAQGLLASQGEIYPKLGRRRRRASSTAPGYDDDVRGQSDGGGAMEVVRHGKSESHLHDGGNEEQFPCGEGESDCGAHKPARPLLSDEKGDACGDELQIDAELGHARGQKRGIVVGVPMGERLLLELGGALQDGDSDGGDDQ